MRAMFSKLSRVAGMCLSHKGMVGCVKIGIIRAFQRGITCYISRSHFRFIPESEYKSGVVKKIPNPNPDPNSALVVHPLFTHARGLHSPGLAPRSEGTGSYFLAT